MKFLKGKDIRVLSDYCLSIKNEKEDPILFYLNIILWETLYLSIEQSLYLNRNHLNILNSFERGKTTNRGFRVFITISSIERYIDFFLLFFNFIYRGFKDLNNREPSYLSFRKEERALLNRLIGLTSKILEEEGDNLEFIRKRVNLSKNLKNKLFQIRNRDLFRVNISNSLEEEEEEEEGEEEEEEDDEEPLEEDNLFEDIDKE